MFWFFVGVIVGYVIKEFIEQEVKSIGAKIVAKIQNGKKYYQHTVSEGNTLFGLQQMYGCPVEEILNAYLDKTKNVENKPNTSK
jgi:LysM repeat protein